MPITLKELKERRRQQQKLVQEHQNIIDRQIDTSPSRAGIAARHIRTKVSNMSIHPTRNKINLTRAASAATYNALKRHPTIKNRDIADIVKKTLKATQRIATTPSKRGARGRKRHRKTRKHRKHKKK